MAIFDHYLPPVYIYIYICIVVDLAIKLICCSKDQGGYICLWVSMTTLNSEEITLWSASVGGGYICLWVLMTTLNNEEITLCSVRYMGGYICLWVPMTTLNSEEITLCSVRYMGGYIVRFTWCHTDISWYLPISWLFAWAVIDCIEKQRVHSELWQFQLGGYIIRFTWCHTDISLYLPISWGVTLTFPNIFLLVDCFKWALIDCIEKCRVHSELWQFWMGGFIVRFTWCHTDISLYLPISWLFRMGSHWLHWKAKSSLWALAVSNWGG